MSACLLDYIIMALSCRLLSSRALSSRALSSRALSFRARLSRARLSQNIISVVYKLLTKFTDMNE
jgi:hypothetical protein